MANINCFFFEHRTCRKELVCQQEQAKMKQPPSCNVEGIVAFEEPKNDHELKLLYQHNILK